MPKRIDRRVSDRLDKAEQRASAVPLKQNVSGSEVEVSLGGLRVSVTFTADGEQTVTLPTALPNIPRHVEPMSVMEHAPHTEAQIGHPLPYVPSAVNVTAVDSASWTRKTVKLWAKSNDMDDDPYPATRLYRVY